MHTRGTEPLRSRAQQYLDMVKSRGLGRGKAKSITLPTYYYLFDSSSPNSGLSA